MKSSDAPFQPLLGFQHELFDFDVGPLRWLEVNAQHLRGFLDDRGAFSAAARNEDSRRQPRRSQRPPGNHPQREGLSGRLEVGATHDPEQPTFRISEDRRGQFALLQLGQ